MAESTAQAVAKAAVETARPLLVAKDLHAWYGESHVLHGMNLEAETVPSPIGNARTLIFIDDEENIRESMKLLLEQWDFEVLLASSIDEAVAHAVHHHEPIHAVVSDLRLRNGEDGLQAIARVKGVLGPDLPAVLVTGDTSPEQVKRVHDSGLRVLFKPVQPKALFSVLRQLG